MGAYIAFPMVSLAQALGARPLSIGQQVPLCLQGRTAGTTLQLPQMQVSGAEPRGNGHRPPVQHL